ncbi:MAG: hypothetical protein HYW63_02460 [Candidatus Levybacteria bacterium]|nr:hypothetical protein [Candidatus Levybacteria bacterium]
MIRPESRLTYFTEEVKSAIEREPIVLGPESVGTHFRNPEEIYDIEHVIAEQSPPIAVGLVGSRLEGRLSYSPKQLFDKMRSYGQRDVQLQALGNRFYAKHGIPPEGYQRNFNRIAAYLKGACLSSVNLDHINLSDYPPQLLRFLTFEPYHDEVPFIFRPKGFEEGDPTVPILQRPAAYYPDINLAIITEHPLKGGIAVRPENRTIGKLSGVCIQLCPIYPTLKLESKEQQAVVDSMLQTFRPLSPIPKSSTL